jgi:hypothetical protein
VNQARNLVAGCVAAVNGAPQLADRSFAAAAQLSASMGSNAHLAEIYVEWARYTPDEALAESLRALAAGIRSGSLSAREAEALRSAKL